MKPGKFILDWDFKVVDLYDLQTNKCLIELDKRFIDREELKEKINKKIREYDYQLGEFSYTKKYRQIKEERIEELKEILALLK